MTSTQPRSLGPVTFDGPCFIVAEVAQAHDGSLGLAHSYIDAAAAAGADGVKFQVHIAEAESTAGEPWRIKFSKQDASRFDYWRRMEFTAPQWEGLREHTAEAGLQFVVSPFSPEAVDLIAPLEPSAWKIASGEVTNLPMIRQLAATGVPVIVSSGMSPLAELDDAVALIKAAGVPVALLQCTSSYPCPPEAIGLNVLAELRDRHHCPVGLSDHSGTIFPALAAVALGASVLELHVTFSRLMFGPDASSSLTVEELTRLVEGVRFTETMLAHPVDKDAASHGFEGSRQLFMKSIVVKQALPAGTRLDENHLALKKPGTGLPVSQLDEVLGRTLKTAVGADHFLTMDDLEQTSDA